MLALALLVLIHHPSKSSIASGTIGSVKIVKMGDWIIGIESCRKFNLLFHSSGYRLFCIASVFQLGKHPWRPKQSTVWKI